MHPIDQAFSAEDEARHRLTKMSQMQSKAMPTLEEQIIWLASITTAEADESQRKPLIPGLRIGHPVCKEHGTSQWPICSTPNWGGSCAGRGWVPTQGAEALWTLWLWVERQISKRASTNHAYAADVGSIYVRQGVIEAKLVELAVAFVQDLMRRGEALAPKEEARG